MMKSTYVLVYGSLKRGWWNNRVLGNSRYVGEGITISDSFSMYDGAFPYVLMGGISKIHGEIFEVTEESVLVNLDRLEGVPNHYNRTIVEVKAFCDDDVRIPGMEDIYDCIMYVASHSTAAHVSGNHAGYRISPDHNNILSWKDKRIA